MLCSECRDLSWHQFILGELWQVDPRMQSLSKGHDRGSRTAAGPGA